LNPLNPLNPHAYLCTRARVLLFIYRVQRVFKVVMLSRLCFFIENLEPSVFLQRFKGFNSIKILGFAL